MSNPELLATPTSPAGARRMLLVLAHPDDETLGSGGTIARYTAEGVEVHLVTATSSQKGWVGDPYRHPGEAALGRVRSDERHRYLWGTQEFYRALSVVNGGREKETDLFAGVPAWALTAAA